jgi:5'-deoxynucleotidase YfbR-like HD superfamily hydrolase
MMNMFFFEGGRGLPFPFYFKNMFACGILIVMKITSQIQRAINLAARLHEGQTRRDKARTPFIVHPFSVATILCTYTNKEEVIIAGLLHDVLEDVSHKKYSEKDMRRDFGHRVTNIVKEVTEKKFLLPKRDDVQKWMRKKKYYLKHLEKASKEALLVSAADKIHNLRSLIDEYQVVGGTKLWHHFSGSPEQQMEFYGNVSRVISKRLRSPLVKELERTVKKAKKVLL